MAFWFLIFCLLAAHPHPVSAASLGSNFRVGSWLGGAYSDDHTRKFARCTATTAGADGTVISYSVDHQFDWSVTLSNPKWNFPIGAVQNVRLKFGDMKRFLNANAVVINKTSLRLRSSDPIFFFAKLRMASKLTVIAGGLILQFSLVNGEESLSALTNCAVRSTHSYKDLRLGSSLFSPREDAMSRADQKEATALASYIIAYADVPHSTIISDANNTFILPVDAAWKVDLITAGVTINQAAISNSQLAEAIIANAFRACHGGFYFISMRDKIGNTPTIRVFESCETDQTTTSNHYLIIPRTRGGHYILAVVSTGSSFFGIAHDAADEYELRLKATIQVAMSKLN